MIQAKACASWELDLNGMRALSIRQVSRCAKPISQELYRLRQRRGVTLSEARMSHQ